MAKKTPQPAESKPAPTLGQPIPFDEALRRMVNAPPQHKTKKPAKGPPDKD